jgi:hypothetical protein
MARGIPAVSWKLKDGTEPGFSLFDLADRLRVRGWQVPAYTLLANCEKQAIQRILVRSGVARVPGSSGHGRTPCGPPWCFWSVSRGSSARRIVLRLGQEPVRHDQAPVDRGRTEPEDQRGAEFSWRSLRAVGLRTWF